MCETCCVNGRHAKNMLNIKISRHTLFVIISGMFWRNFTTIRRICIPYKFGQSGCIPPKIICEIFAWRLFRLIKPQTNGTTGPPSVCDNRSRFPGKSIALQHVFYIAQSSEIQVVDAVQ